MEKKSDREEIGIFLNPYSTKGGGLERHAFETTRALIEANQCRQYIIYVDPQYADQLKFKGSNWKVIEHDYSVYTWRLFGWVRKKSDLYIFFVPIVPIFHTFKKTVVVFYDAAFVTFFGKGFRSYINHWIQFLLQKYGMTRATRVVAISEASKNDAAHKLGIRADKIDIIYCGFNRINESVATQPQNVPAGKYFLYVGPVKKRKNVYGIVRAYIILRKKYSEQVSLVIAGRQSENEKKEIREILNKDGLTQCVSFPGYTTDGELKYLYEHASGFVFPSLLEGFGLPVLEAMGCGCPVITSNISSLPEVGGDAALLVDPYDASAIANAMYSLLTDPSLVDTMREKGYKRVEQFSWEVSAEQWKKLIEKIQEQ